MSGDILRLAAFSDGEQGGNPAGVVFLDAFPPDAEMLRVAAEVGYSETAFLVPSGDAWRLRYFAPRTEVPFCGHATIALGAALGEAHGAGVYRLILNDADISVTAERADNGLWRATLVSPPTRSKRAPETLTAELLAAFDLSETDLEPELPVSVTQAGATHAVIPMRSRERLARMSYAFEPMRVLMHWHNLITINLIWRAPDGVIHSRNAFAPGGVVEDPATGAAAAALGGLLRDKGILRFRNGSASFDVRQGDDMGQPSRLRVEVTPKAGEGVRVSGTVRPIAIP